MQTIISSVASYLPERVVSTFEIEEEIKKSYPELQAGLIESMTGVKSRRYIEDGEFCSDLAIKAGKKCLHGIGMDVSMVDLLIFASASQDIIEPATANIVQNGLGLSCPVFDVKNACNSFMNAIEIADAFIKGGKYKNILICSGETPSQVVKCNISNRKEFKDYFSGYTLGDAGASMLLTGTYENKGILHSYFYSDGETRDVVTIMGGGSRSPRNPEDVYFCGNPVEIRDKFISIGSGEFEKGLEKIGRKASEISRVYVHQVAMKNFEYMQETLGIEEGKFSIILPELGNIASCCIPTSFAFDWNKGIHKSGDKIVFIGFASGFSYGLVYYQW